ncbi:MAG: DUF1579 family protein [Saprospiraceae bacterium]|nr:DUF1579 family protein [Saprospiraceae bacterium]
MKKSIKYLTAVAIMGLANIAVGQSGPTCGLGNLGWLSNLDGHWQALVKITIGQEQSETMYYADFSTTSDGQAVLMKEESDIPNVGKLHGTNLIGFDPNDGKIHWFTVDNLGTTHEHIGSFSNQHHFVMARHSMQNGKNYKEDISMHLKGSDNLDLKVTATIDGVIQEIIEGTFVRDRATVNP